MKEADRTKHGSRRLVRYALAVALALSFAAASSAMAADMPPPDWNGVNLTGAPTVVVGLHLSHAYWHLIVPATVTIVDLPGYLAVAEIAPMPDGGYGRHIGVTRTALATWPAGTRARRTELPALLVHEYGHLLGYHDGELYATDPRHVMLGYDNYLSTPGGRLHPGPGR